MTANYLHYSFDLWLTLIKSDPAFKEARALYFHRNFNYRNRSLDEVKRVFRQVDLMCNLINERTGKNIDADEMYLMVLSLLNDNAEPVWAIDVAQLYTDMEDLLFKHLPLVYSEDTLPVLAHIKNSGCTISLLSNTGFIKGVTLRRVLNQIGMDQYIDYQLYSDEAGMSKPNPAFFELMLDQLKAYHNTIELTSILHIGDNPVADMAGANAVGIHSRLVNSNNVYLPSLINNAHNILLT